MTPDELTEIQGIGEKTVERIRRVVTEYFEQDRGTAEVPPQEEVAQAGSEPSTAETTATEATPTTNGDARAGGEAEQGAGEKSSADEEVAQAGSEPSTAETTATEATPTTKEDARAEGD